MIRILLILCLLAISSLTKAEVINNLVINGNKRVSDETIKIYGEIELNKDIEESDINKIIKNLYSTIFFNDVSIKINKNTLVVSVVEHPVINQLIILGEPKKNLESQIKKIISLKENKSFIRSFLAKDIATIKNLYSSLGYNFAEIVTKSKIIDQDNLDLIFDIKKGNQTKITSISFIGNKSVRSKRLKDVIARKINFGK